MTGYYDPLEEPGGKQLKQAASDAFAAVGEARSALAPFAGRADLRAIAFLLDRWGDDARTRPELTGLSPDVLVPVLGTGSPTARAAAARLLGDLGDEHSTEALIAALGDEHPGVRRAAAEALDGCAAVTASSLAAQLKSEDPEVRGWVADRLGEAGGSEAAEQLTGALEDESADVRARAAIALGKLGDPRAQGPLLAALKQRGAGAMEAFHSLQEIGGAEVEEAFAAGTPKVGDRVRVRITGDVYAGIGSDRIEMGTGTVGEWRGTVMAVSEEGWAGVRCDEVEGEVESVTPGTTHRMTLDPRHASELANDPGQWCFEL